MQTSTPRAFEPKPKIKNWIWKSIAVSVLLFFTGIIGVFFAIVSRVKLKRGNLQGAIKAEKWARIATVISFWIGIVLAITEIIYFIKTGKNFEDLLFNYNLI